MNAEPVFGPLTLNSFRPFGNNWKEDVDGPRVTQEDLAEIFYEVTLRTSRVAQWVRTCLPKEGDPKYIIDSSTGDKYLNHPIKMERIILGFCLVGTTLLSPFMLVCKAVSTVFHTVSFYHFRATRSFSLGLQKTGIEIVQTILYPVGLVGIAGASLYGQFFPRNGDKLTTSINRLFA